MGISNYSRSRRNKRKPPISDINITPFVDVLLVLLIIFMVAAPMMTSGVDVSLPKGAGKPNTVKNKPIAVSIKPDGTIFVEEEIVKLSSLSDKLIKISKNNLNNKIHIKADKNLDYGRVMNVVKTVNLSGFQQVVLITELVQ